MAYMSKEKKAVIAAALKGIIPSGWKWSLRINDHSTLVLTIAAAPIDLVAASLRIENATRARNGEPMLRATYTDLNPYYLGNYFSGDLLALFERIKAAMNTGNWDRSDSMTDYFDVGHYIGLYLGRWDKPFRVLAKEAA